MPCCDASTKPRPRSRLFSVCSRQPRPGGIHHDPIISEEITDGASPELLSIRRELRRVSGKVRETLNRMISGERSKYLQENIITQRNGRFVVPVKVEHRGDVPGLVHDTSSTGATVFVEPQQVVEINNQIKVLEGREENEIERILAELSSRMSMYKGAIEQDYDALTTLDFIFARAKLSFDMNACAPVLVEDGSRCKLLRARHPLLDKDKAVPIDIAIGYDYDTLVITGPNTGGKTVSLKTLGLLSLMAASGLHIPANEQSEIGLFEHVYADIGDEQSIEQSLSTFSAHMPSCPSWTAAGRATSCCSTNWVRVPTRLRVRLWRLPLSAMPARWARALPPPRTTPS
ncbi:MAG: MutS-related protein [Butyricicoccus sp.]